jgi:GNAT superfamily N-acetyltransferase
MRAEAIPMEPYRTATPDDAAAIAEIVTLAFSTDPLWGPLLSRPDGGLAHQRAYWDIVVAGALRYPATGAALDDGRIGAVAIWIPWGATELTEEQEQQVDDLIRAELPERVDELHELFRRFEESRPHEPHHYLSLFAAHPEHRGRGLGMGLLRHDLERLDELGIAAYLESSNPANDARYAGVGFELVGRFESPMTGAPVTTMWRSPR